MSRYVLKCLEIKVQIKKGDKSPKSNFFRNMNKLYLCVTGTYIGFFLTDKLIEGKNILCVCWGTFYFFNLILEKLKEV